MSFHNIIACVNKLQTVIIRGGNFAVCIFRYVLTLRLRSKYDVDGSLFHICGANP